MKKRLLFLLKFGVAAGILAYIFRQVPISQVLNIISSARPLILVFAFFLIFIVLYMAAFEMSLLTQRQGMGLSIHGILKINLATRFYGLFLPGTLAGGAIRWYKLSQPDCKAMEALLSILASRVLDTLAILTVGFFFWSWMSHLAPHAIMGLVLLMLVYICFFLSVYTRSRLFCLDILIRINKNLRHGFLKKKIDSLLVTLMNIKIPPGLISFILIMAILRNLLSCAAFYLFAVSLNISLSFIQAAWIASLSLLIGMLPVSFFGLGIREGTFIVLLQPYGVSAQAAVALSFLVILKMLAVGTAGGVVEAGSHFFIGKNLPEKGELPV